MKMFKPSIILSLLFNVDDHYKQGIQTSDKKIVSFAGLLILHFNVNGRGSQFLFA